MKWVGVLSLIVTCHAAPGWMNDGYQEMMTSFSNFQPNFQKMNGILGDVRRSFNHEFEDVGRHIDEIGDYWGDHFETVGHQMETKLKKFGGDMQDQVTHVRSQIGNLGDRMETVFQSQLGNMDQHLSHFNNKMNHHFGQMGENFDNFGTSLISQFDKSFSQNFDDVFGMFGRQRTPWWKKQNVCVKREVLEEDDDEAKNVNIQVSGNANFHMQVNQCIEKSDSYECIKTVVDDGTVKTLKMTHSCCHGYKNVNGDSCTIVDMKPLEETIAELEAEEFLELLVANELDSLLENVTVFVPTDEAIRDMDFELEELYIGNEIENVVYNIDDGLLNKRKKRSIPVDTAANLLKGHIINGFHSIHDLVESELVTSANTNNDKVRVSIYPTNPPTVMANCAKIISRNNHATNGIVHVVDKVVVPAADTIAEVLSDDLHFKTLMDALEQSDLVEALSEPGHFTLFAPTDEAFEKLDDAVREKVLGRGGCSTDFIRSHVLSEVVCSGIVEGPVKVTNIAGHDMTLTKNDDGSIEIEGVKLFMKDKMTSNGVIHVIEDVIVQPAVMSVMDHLKQNKANKMLQLLESAGLEETFENLKNLTFFMPSEKAISEIPKVVLDELVKDKTKLAEILLHHVASHSAGSCHLKDNLNMATEAGTNLRVNLHKHFGHPTAMAMVQCARIIQKDNKVCGGNVHTIDRVLTPPSGDVVATLQSNHPKFHELIKRANMEKELSEGLLTVLAPVDKAFDRIDGDISDDDVESVVRNHLIESPLCCASVLQSSGFLHERRVRSNYGDALSFHRSNGGHIYANQAAIIGCDQAATNGVVHSIDSLILPRNMKNNKKKSFWIF